MSEYCVISRCRRPSDFIYYNKQICAHHWDLHCDEKRPFDLRDKFGIQKIIFKERILSKRRLRKRRLRQLIS